MASEEKSMSWVHLKRNYEIQMFQAVMILAPKISLISLIKFLYEKKEFTVTLFSWNTP